MAILNTRGQHVLRLHSLSDLSENAHKMVLEKAMTDAEKKEKHHQITVSSAPLAKWMEENGLKHREAAEKLSVSASGISGWLAKGKMPGLVLHALNGIKRVQKSQPSEILYLSRVPLDKVGDFERICAAFEVPYKTISW